MGKLFFILPVISVIGFLFGKWTCGRKTVQTTGFFATTLTFIFLNLIHSIIDGTLLRSLALNVYSLSIAGTHEIIRQPVLYFFYFTAITPFRNPLWQKIAIGIFSVTGIWILGLIFGSLLAIPSKYLPDHEIALYIYAFFLGDIGHHCNDYIRRKRKNR